MQRDSRTLFHFSSFFYRNTIGTLKEPRYISIARGHVPTRCVASQVPRKHLELKNFLLGAEKFFIKIEIESFHIIGCFLDLRMEIVLKFQIL